MKTIGIIAEYNPFHNGHAYQIKKIKEETGADYVVIAMSGDFVQRGTPAIIDKYARAKMALNCGADLVVELPVLWATASAESFAMAGVTLFEKMGCVDGICFGAETDDLPLLSEIAAILAEEPIDYKNALSSYMKEGLSFPTARAKALMDSFNKKDTATAALSEILNSPNNILAIEYLKALKRRNSNMTPLLLKREGTGYHDTAITSAAHHALPATDNADASGICASATAIREALAKLSPDAMASGTNRFDSNNETVAALFDLKRAMPLAAFDILSEYCSVNPWLTANDFSPLLNYRLLLESPKGFDRFLDANIDISNRIIKNKNQFRSFLEFCELNKSRDITYTRISRVLLHILLGLTNDDLMSGKELDYIPYLRMLGFRKDSSLLLSSIKQSSQVPLLSKLADAEKFLDEQALHLLRQDIFAADLYEQVLAAKKNSFPRSEYTRKIVRI